MCLLYAQERKISGGRTMSVCLRAPLEGAMLARQHELSSIMLAVRQYVGTCELRGEE